MNELDDLLRLAKHHHRQGAPALVLQCVDVALQSEAGRAMAAGAGAVELLALGIEADIAMGNFRQARKRVVSALRIIQDLPDADRDDARLKIQALQLTMALGEGHLDTAVDLAIATFNPDKLASSDSDSAVCFALATGELLLALGLLNTAVDLAHYVESHIVPRDAAGRATRRLGLLSLRIHACLLALGRREKVAGPLGWQFLPADQAVACLDTAMSELPPAMADAASLGLTALVARAKLVHEAAIPEREDVDYWRHRLASARDRIQALRSAARWAELLSAEIERAGLLTSSLQPDTAIDRLRRIEPTVLNEGNALRREAWYWQMFRAHQTCGRTANALDCFAEYASLADARRRQAIRLLMQGRRLLGGVACTGTAASSGDAFTAKLQSIAKSARSVEAMAAGMNMTSRRLQQLMRVHGLPPPRSYLKMHCPNSEFQYLR